MPSIELQVPESDLFPGDPEFPNGHARSFRRGIVSGLMDEPDSEPLPEGHDLSFQRGKLMGAELRAKVFELERK